MMDNGSGANREHLDALFIEKSYGEAMALVHRSATYLEGDGAQIRDDLDDQLRPVFTAESLRITTRLMQVVSWLMTQRAVLAGEMTHEEALETKHRLGARGICLAEPLEGVELLPQSFLEFAEASRSLYQRIARLEESLLNDEVGNPVHSLLSRLDQN